MKTRRAGLIKEAGNPTGAGLAANPGRRTAWMETLQIFE